MVDAGYDDTGHWGWDAYDTPNREEVTALLDRVRAMYYDMALRLVTQEHPFARTFLVTAIYEVQKITLRLARLEQWPDA